MFTGLIEEIGIIDSIKQRSIGLEISISCQKVLSDIFIDASVAVNGVCLTVIDFSNYQFTCQAIYETVKNTNLKLLKKGNKVNLERALQLSSRLGGHVVQGHIDGLGNIMSKRQVGIGFEYVLRTTKDICKFVVKKGSICLNGVSLTIADLSGCDIIISVIPHTINNTNLMEWNIGDIINIETDILGRYLDKLINIKPEKGSLSIGKLKELGF